jgi:coiled-coil domain-containing protein 130
VQAPRLEELQAAADAQGEDPYSHSLRVRKRFRAEKKTEQARAAVDTALRDKYALPEALALVRDDADTAAQDHAEWERARAVTREADSNKRRRIADRPLTAAVRSGGSGSSRGKPAALSALGQRILQNTARRTAGSRLGNG